MIVSQENFGEVIRRILSKSELAFDCETTGLRVWQKDRLFSLIIADEEKEFYFNFQEYPGIQPLPRGYLQLLKPAFDDPTKTWIAANAKFDMACLFREGLTIAGTVYCTEAQGRVERNDRLEYNLAALGAEIGHHKDDAVAEYIKAHQLYRYEGLDAKGEPVKVPDYTKVPFDIIVPYGCQDARVAFKLRQHQLSRITLMSAAQPPGVRTPAHVQRVELKLTKTLFGMERDGILLDRKYVSEAVKHEAARVQESLSRFEELSQGVKFVDSAKCLAPVFDRAGELYPVTEKGNPSFKQDVLADMKSPLAKCVLDFRDASKKLNTYYLNFLKFSDEHGRIHANCRQGGTATGRVSYSEPNLQNLTKEFLLDCAACGENLEEPDEPCTKCQGLTRTPRKWLVRRSFIPTPGNLFVKLDYDQVEYRMMLDYAGEMGVIDKILNEGLDVHRATAQMMGVGRRDAKTLNFMLLYGGGVAKLCAALFSPFCDVETLKALVKIHLWGKRLHSIHDAADIVRVKRVPTDKRDHDVLELRKAQRLLDLYFARLPKVREFIYGVKDRATARGYVRNWAGRILHCKMKQFAYKLPNHLIQGGAGDAMKCAMVEVDDFYSARNAQTRMVIQVHDELDLDVPRNELELVAGVKQIMETVYPSKHLPLTVGVEYSNLSLAEGFEEVPA